MSIGAITKVFATCPEEKSEYLVLIAMADQANDDGRDIWFKWETIAHKARIDPRTAQLIVEKLLKKGRLLVETGAAPRGYDLYHIVFPSEPYTRATFQANREARRLEKRETGRTSYGQARKEGPDEAPKGQSENFSIPRLGTESEEFSEKSEEFSRKSENFSLGTTVPRPPSAAEVAPETSFKHPLNRSVSNVVEDPRAGGREGAQPVTPLGGISDQSPHTTGGDQEKGVKAVRDLAAGVATLPPVGGAAHAAVTDIHHTPQNPATATQEAQEVTAGEKVPGGAALAVLGAPVASVDDLLPIPADDLRVRPRATPADPVYRAIKGMVGGNRAIDDGILDGATPAGGLPRMDWLRLTEQEIAEVRATAQAEAQAKRLNFYTTCIRGLDRLIGAPIGQTGTRGPGAREYATPSVASYAPGQHYGPADHSQDQGKYEPGAQWRNRKSGEVVTLEGCEQVKRKSTDGMVYRLSGNVTVDGLQLMARYEFVGRVLEATA